jgi:hypothetical protein
MNPSKLGSVIRLLSDDQLLLNVGGADGVISGEIFEVLDPRTQNVIDPTTGDSLGSLDRVKARVRVVELADRLSVAEIYPARKPTLSIAAQVMVGQTRSNQLTRDIWPEGVAMRDPVRSVGLT